MNLKIKNYRKQLTIPLETKREEKESRVAELANDLKEQNQDKLKLSDPHFRLWARMYVFGVYDSLDDTPNIPMITGTASL